MEHAHTELRSGRLRTAVRSPMRHQVEVRLDPDPFWMSALRALITDLAIRADFDLDAVADLTLAVDEACAVLIGVAAPHDTLVCQFAVGVDGVTVTVSLPGGWRPDQPGLPTDTFGWRVIRTLTDDVDVLDEGCLGIRLTKYLGAAPGRHRRADGG